MTLPSTPKTILIVDDTPINIGVISGALKDSFATKVATSGEKALAIASGKDKPDLILLDILMPEMDGYEVCRRLKADPDTRDIPVIFLTSQTEAEDETKGFEVGAVDYIHKPFSAAVVKARVRTHLMLREAHAVIARQLVEINTELEMARQIQLSILPSSTPKITGLDIVARYIPMTSVAGDFYDFIVVDERHVGILIADVSGHGLPAALIASMLQVALTAQARHVSEPSKVLAGLNQALCGKFQHNFVTAAYVYVDLEKNIMNYGGAGHPPLLLWRKSTGSASELLENGLVMGQFEEATYDSLQVPIEPGDRFFLYTDGILETCNPAQEEFGTDRFMKFMETNNKLPAGPFADALMLELARWLEQPPGEGHKDDISLLAIDFTTRA
ncbi:MAG: SpoIIE family protein phosphatase [Candidatus Acidiferrales bacterium]|jgi:sigma-B regulation protein RsbU (phosphoserine phosphatase)